jgi:hypothetical protein
MPINDDPCVEVKPLEAIDLLDGKVKAFDLKPGHYVFFINDEQIQVESLVETSGLLPEGSTGGWIICCRGPLEDAVRIFRMENI